MNTGFAYQEEARDELINGQIVLMSPSPAANHVIVVGNIYAIFHAYLKGKQCTPFMDGLDVYLTEKDRFEPDMMVVCDPQKIKYNGVHGAPDLVVEVLSPSTAKRDRSYKKQVYEQCGVREYWLVNIADRSIEQYLLADGQLQLAEVYALPGDYLTEAERAPYITELKCSLYDDLRVSLEDVFYRVK